MRAEGTALRESAVRLGQFSLRVLRGFQANRGLLLAGGVQALGPSESAIYKPRWGAFYETPLEEHLRERGLVTTTRRTRGDDIAAACGQLAGKVSDRVRNRLSEKRRRMATA